MKDDPELNPGMIVKKGRKKFLVKTVNHSTVVIQRYQDLASKGSNKRTIILGEVQTVNKSDVRPTFPDRTTKFK